MTSIGRKGEVVAVLPAYGGLQPRACIKKPGLWVSVLIDEHVDAPGFQMDVGVLQEALKAKPSSYVLERTIGIPLALQILGAAGNTTQVGVTPLMQFADWAPPWPETQLSGPVSFDPVLEVLHAATDDPLRPELGCVSIGQGLAYAGDEAQFARAIAPGLGMDLQLVPTSAFQKWPALPVGVQYCFTHSQVTGSRAYFRIGDELRIAAIPSTHFWSRDVVDSVAQSAGRTVFFDLHRHYLLAPFKAAKRIAERRLVALGYSAGMPWIRIGETVTSFESHLQTYSILNAEDLKTIGNWQVVLDGNRLLDLLKGIAADTVRVEINPINPRAAVCFGHVGYIEALFPLLLMDEKST